MMIQHMHKPAVRKFSAVINKMFSLLSCGLNATVLTLLVCPLNCRTCLNGMMLTSHSTAVWSPDTLTSFSSSSIHAKSNIAL